MQFNHGHADYEIYIVSVYVKKWKDLNWTSASLVTVFVVSLKVLDRLQFRRIKQPIWSCVNL